MTSESETEFRTAAARLAQVLRHHPPGMNPRAGPESLHESVRHLADLVDADAEADHLENAALAVIDIYDRSGLENADAAVIAAMERLRETAAQLDEST